MFRLTGTTDVDGHLPRQVQGPEHYGEWVRRNADKEQGFTYNLQTSLTESIVGWSRLVSFSSTEVVASGFTERTEAMAEMEDVNWGLPLATTSALYTVDCNVCWTHWIGTETTCRCSLKDTQIAGNRIKLGKAGCRWRCIEVLGMLGDTVRLTRWALCDR